jgi:uncharacterized protein (DUF4415 family)
MSHNKMKPDLENREWTKADFAKARRPEAVLPANVLAAFPRTRGAQKTPRKVPLSIRLSPDVVEHYKATGPGWQTRIEEDLRKAAGL